MGLFDKLAEKAKQAFEKKNCSICNGEIGLLGNRKLEDGNLCKNCAGKLSPFFSERRHSTVEEISRQLAYRAANAERFSALTFDRTFGFALRKLYVDTASQVFCLATGSPARLNADIIAIGDVISAVPKIAEHKTEIYTKDAEGKRVSYDPKQYEYSYDFDITLEVRSEWFDRLELAISNGYVKADDYDELDKCRGELEAAMIALTGGCPSLRTFERPAPEPTEAPEEITPPVKPDLPPLRRPTAGAKDVFSPPAEK